MGSSEPDNWCVGKCGSVSFEIVVGGVCPFSRNSLQDAKGH